MTVERKHDAFHQFHQFHLTIESEFQLQKSVSEHDNGDLKPKLDRCNGEQ